MCFQLSVGFHNLTVLGMSADGDSFGRLDEQLKVLSACFVSVHMLSTFHAECEQTTHSSLALLSSSGI